MAAPLLTDSNSDSAVVSAAQFVITCAVDLCQVVLSTVIYFYRLLVNASSIVFYDCPLRPGSGAVPDYVPARVQAVLYNIADKLDAGSYGKCVTRLPDELYRSVEDVAFEQDEEPRRTEIFLLVCLFANCMVLYNLLLHVYETKRLNCFLKRLPDLSADMFPNKPAEKVETETEMKCNLQVQHPKGYSVETGREVYVPSDVSPRKSASGSSSSSAQSGFIQSYVSPRCSVSPTTTSARSCHTPAATALSQHHITTETMEKPHRSVMELSVTWFCLWVVCRFICEYVVLVLPSVLAMAQPDAVLVVWALVFGATYILISISLRGSDPEDFQWVNPMTKGASHIFVAGERVFLSDFKFFITSSTCIAILAVDFFSFPRRFAKTKNFGYSLMDMGVGMTILSMGVFSKAARAIKYKHSGISDVFETMKRMWPLLLMGFARLIVHSYLGLVTPVSEYGVHWNIFFSLAVVEIVCKSLLNLVVPAGYAYLYGLGIAAVWQFVLSGGGLEDYMLNAPRTGFLSQNREGIFGCIGLCALYLVGVSIGRYLMGPEIPPRLSCRGVVSECSPMGRVFAMYWIAMCLYALSRLYSWSAGIECSRRMVG
eukprot:GHVQ01003677.1.p1 GENE.GHVQ01003677.1~~GHVQ01003677.1.p1  ORF type:complete len:598 (-),score=48.20 GHVQ01003677.1:105-1898(-)